MTINFRGETIILIKKKYGNGRLAITSICEDGIPYATFTVNLVDEKISKSQAFLDTNNVPDLEEVLKTTGIISGNPLRYGISGYCSYPLYEINF